MKQRLASRVSKNLKQIEYRSGILEKGMEVDELPVRVWSADRIPEELREAIHQEHLLDLGGVHGNRELGDPVEYDNLKLVLTDRMVEITVFNRGIILLFMDNERVRRIHRILCKLDAIP